MKNSITLTLEEILNLAVNELVHQGKLENKRTYVDWKFNNYKPKDSIVFLSQED